LELQELTGIAGPTPDYHRASLQALVLSAIDIPHRLENQEGLWVLLVPERHESAARREIAAYEEENRNWPPVPPTDPFILAAGDQPPTVLLMGALFIFYLTTGPWAAESVWFAAGAVNSERILMGGEWWRLVTSLTLHADPVHLLGNLFIGGVLVHFLCKRLGSGLGLFLLLLSGTLGNLVNVLLRPEHQAVGFSTALFGAVGLLSGLQMRRGVGSVKAILLPLGAALSLLAFLGAEGERTDLGAHFWGLAAGLVLGVVLVHTVSGARLALPRWQTLLFYASLFVVAGSWKLALG
jgi:rhomboid protease GluP